MALIATIKCNHFSAGLAKVLRAQKNTPLLPIIEKVLLKTIPKGILLSATNLDTHILTGIAAQVTEKDVQILIPPAAFNVLLQLTQDFPIEIHMTGDEVNFKYGDNYIRCSNENANTFPSMPEIMQPIQTLETDMSGEELQNVFAACVKFTSSDELRPALTGVCMKPEQLIATDSYRMIIAALPITAKFPNILLNKGCINAINSLDKAAKIRIQFNEQFISFNDKSTKIVGRLLNATPPDYARVLPQSHEIEIEVNRLELLNNIKLSKHVANSTDTRLSITYTNEAYEITGTDQDLFQEIKLTGTCKFKKNEKLAGSFAHALNGRLFIPVLESLTSEFILIEANASENPVVIRDAGYTFLMMPLTTPKKK